MATMPFWGSPTDPYYSNYFTNKNYTPTQLDTMATDPSQRSMVWDLLRNARFGDNANLSGSYSGYLGNMGSLASQLFGLQGRLGVNQPKGTDRGFESFTDFFNAMFRAPTAGNPRPDTMGLRTNDLLKNILAGGERARSEEGLSSDTPGGARGKSLGMLNDVLALLSMSLPAEALQSIQGQGSDLYNKFQMAQQGQTNAPTFMQWLNQRGYVPGAA